MTAGACRQEMTFADGNDLTEDLHHRLISGLWRPDKEPMILQVHRGSQKVEGVPVRVSWERGSFSVWSDDRALVVFYMDAEATYSHVVVQPQNGYTLGRQFRSAYGHPIR